MTPEQTVDRYTVTRNHDGLGFSNGIEPDAAGGFVSYEDYLAQREQIKALQKRVKAADKLADDIESIVSYSEGVAGLHLNGDIAPWDSLLVGGDFEEWLASLSAYRATGGHGNGT